MREHELNAIPTILQFMQLQVQKWGHICLAIIS